MTEKAYLPVCTDGDSDVDCIIEYEVTGFYSLHLTACKVYDDGPDILPMIDEAEQGRMSRQYVAGSSGKKNRATRGR